MAQKMHCNKEAEIAEIHTEMNTIKKVVMGNSKDGLVTTVPKLSQSVETLSMNVVSLERGLKGFLRYQQTMEGISQGKEQIRNRNKWIIGILASVIMGLAGMLVALIIKL